jgi:hypothetical protein
VQVAIARGFVFVAIGDNGQERIVELLDRGKETEATAAAPTDWQPVLRHAPAGNNGIGQADLHGVLTTQVAALTALLALALPTDLAELLPDYSFATLAEEITPLLERHGLRTVRTATGHDGRRYSFRVFW